MGEDQFDLILAKNIQGIRRGSGGLRENIAPITEQGKERIFGADIPFQEKKVEHCYSGILLLFFKVWGVGSLSRTIRYNTAK
jgi:hypothetical protein